MAEISNNSILGLIGKVKELTRLTSDDTRHPDELIYSIMLDHRNLLLYRELNKHKFISKFLFKTICMPLEKSNQIPCDCVPANLGCIVLKSKYKIPKPLRYTLGNLFKVLTLDGNIEFSFQEIRQGKFNKYKRTNSLKPFYTIYNEYLYLIGYPQNNLKAILIEMIPEDPTEVDNISLCDENGNELGDTCFDPLTDTFSIDSHLISSLIELTLKDLGVSLSVPEDISNNTLSAIPEKSF